VAEPANGAPKPNAHDTELLLLRSCVGALWADGSMAAAERDHVSHLIDRVARSDGEREQLRRLALHGVDVNGLLADIEVLAVEARLDLFARCVEMLGADRRLRRSEMRFLSKLRRRCGVPWWRFEAMIWRHSGMVRRTVLALGLVAAMLAIVLAPRAFRQEPLLVAPVMLEQRREISLAGAPGDVAELGAEELFERVRRSVVTVNVAVDGGRHGLGSGVVLGVDDLGQLYVLTNRHVVYHELPQGQALGYDIQLESGVRLPTVLDFYSGRFDLALLLVPGLSRWAVPLPLRPPGELRVGQHVYAVGSPMGLDHSFTSGVISGLRGRHIQTDATVHSGSSGGPLLDGSGRICGVITTTHRSKDLSFALDAGAIVEMLAERRQGSGGRLGPAGPPALDVDSSRTEVEGGENE
jgi:hypothetical protein